jgi:hypothetical protein
MTIDELRVWVDSSAVPAKQRGALLAALDVVEGYEDWKTNRDDGAPPPDAEVDAFFRALDPKGAAGR